MQGNVGGSSVALELQISTQQAQANIEAATGAIRDFITVTQQLSRGAEQIDAFTGALAAIRPINPEVVASINAVVQAATSLNGAVGSVERFSAALSGIGTGGAAQAATAIQQVGNAAANVKGTQIDAIAAGMGQAGRAAAAAVNPMAAVMSTSAGLSRSLDSVAQGMSFAGQSSATTGTHLDRLAQGMTQAGQAAAAGVGNFNGLGNATREAGDGADYAGRHYSVFAGILEAMAFSAAISGLRSLVEGSADASAAVQRLKIQIDVSTGTAGAGAEAYKHLADRSFQLGIPIEALTKSFGRFVNAMTAGGHSLAQSTKVYDNFSTVFRALGLSTDETTRAFIAVDQVFQKGKVQSEELTRQLGQSIPAMELLAKSMGLVDSAGKPLTGQLQELMKKGQVSSDVFIKFSEDLANKYAPALSQAAATGQAALVRLQDGFFALKVVIGDSIWASIKGEMNSLAGALFQVNGPLQTLGSAFGYIVGGVGAAFLYTVQSWGQALGTVTQIVSMAAQGWGEMAQALSNMIPAGSGVQQVLSGVGQVLGQIGAFLGPFASVIISGAVAWGVFGNAITRTWQAIAAGAGLVVNVLANPFVQVTLVSAAVVAAIAAVAIAAKSLWDTLTSGGTFTENFKANLQSIGDFAGQVTDKLFNIQPAAQAAAGGMDQAAQSTDGAAEAFNMARPTTEQYAEQIKNLTQAGHTVVSSQNEAATGADNYASAAHRGASAANSLSSGFYGSASAADGAAIAYGRAASAANQYAAAAANAGSSMSNSVRLPGESSSNDFGGGNDLSGNPSDFSFENSGPTHRSGNFSTPSPTSQHKVSDLYPTTAGYVDIRTGKLANGTYTGFSGYYGGIPGQQAAGMQHTTPVKSFVGAPHYAGGGVTPDTTGGIPSILHANEAVVPLRAGGTIPVSLVGTSAQSSDGQANPLVTLLTQIAQDDIERDTLIGATNDKLDLILGQLTTAFPKADTFYSNALNVFNALLGAFNSLGSSGTGRSSSGTGGGSISLGGSGSLTGTTDQSGRDAALRQLQNQLAQNELGKNTKFFDSMRDLQATAGAASINGAGPLANFDYLYQQFYKSDAAKQNAQIDLQNQALIDQFNAQYGKDAFQKATNQDRVGFATGSPNASRDADGGFRATLHPDEAVIPLPDGRAVPVTMPTNMLADLKDIRAMLDAANRTAVATQTARTAGQHTVNNTQKVTMNVYTPDANSFRKSQPQIVADLRGQLQRAQQTSGAVKRLTEDPTKRIVGKA